MHKRYIIWILYGLEGWSIYEETDVETELDKIVLAAIRAGGQEILLTEHLPYHVSLTKRASRPGTN